MENKKTNHTPGPWALSANFHQTQKVVSNDCEVVKLPPTEVGKANAHLISAAPELLAALEEIVSFLETNYDHNAAAMKYCDSSIEAIAKAKGETQ